MHGSIITYLFYSAALSPSYELITKPVMVKLSFDIPQNKQRNTNAPVNKTNTQIIKSKPIVTAPLITQAPEITRTSINELINQERDFLEVESASIQQKYASMVILMIENAWIKPRNIPKDLSAGLRLIVNKSGRILQSELVRSSGNLRFDNSALQAISRTDSFYFYDEIPDDIYKESFRIINLKFNPDND
jgi:TonB family protein